MSSYKFKRKFLVTKVILGMAEGHRAGPLRVLLSRRRAG